MVGGLVEDQQVDRVDHDPGERQPGAPTSGQVADPLFDGVTAEPKLPRMVRRLRPLSSATTARNSSSTVRSKRSVVDLVLGELAMSVGLVADDDLTAHRGHLTQQQPQKGRLASPVGPDERQLLAARPPGRCPTAPQRRRIRPRRRSPRRRHSAMSAGARGRRTSRPGRRVGRLQPIELSRAFTWLWTRSAFVAL